MWRRLVFSKDFLSFFLFLLPWVFVALLGISLATVSFVVACGFLTAVASLVVEHTLQVRGLQ